MDDDKMVLWDRLFPTDPRQTKTFKRAGGFSGTAIKPYWVIMRATEEFGPAGVGWGWNELAFEIYTERESGRAIWFSKVEVWYNLDGAVHRVGPQWGATELVAFRGESKSVFVDEEAAKKAITDGITKCLSYLGLAGDVHMGLFDDSKYVAERRMEERKADEAAAQAERKEKAAVKKQPEADPSNGEPEPEPKPIRKAPPGAKAASQPKGNGEEVRDREGEVIEPSERAWLENVRAKIAKITEVGELIEYWDTQKPMATKVAEGPHAAFAQTAIDLARARIKTLRQGGDK